MRVDRQELTREQEALKNEKAARRQKQSRIEELEGEIMSLTFSLQTFEDRSRMQAIKIDELTRRKNDLE